MLIGTNAKTSLKAFVYPPREHNSSNQSFKMHFKKTSMSFKKEVNWFLFCLVFFYFCGSFIVSTQLFDNACHALLLMKDKIQGGSSSTPAVLSNRLQHTLTKQINHLLPEIQSTAVGPGSQGPDQN